MQITINNKTLNGFSFTESVDQNLNEYLNINFLAEQVSFEELKEFLFSDSLINMNITIVDEDNIEYTFSNFQFKNLMREINVKQNNFIRCMFEK